MIQNFNNLPTELTEQKRFFLVGENKIPLTKDWSNPNNQKLYTDIKGIAGFDISGHDIGVDYLVVDFDHVLTDAGELINDFAKNTFNWIVQSLPTFTERSISKSGFHILLKPTANKFNTITNSTFNTLYFVEDNLDVKLEVFYKTGGRYFLFTGDVVNCEAKTPIADGTKVDDFIKNLMTQIHQMKEAENKPFKQRDPALIYDSSVDSHGKERNETIVIDSLTKHLDDDSEYEAARIERALEIIDPSTLSYEDWLNVGKALESVSSNNLSLWDSWSSRDSARYKAGECAYKWQSFKGSGITRATLMKFAQDAGYNEKEFWHEWHNAHRTAQKKKSKLTAADEEAALLKNVDQLNEIIDSMTAENAYEAMKHDVLKIADSIRDTEYDSTYLKFKNLIIKKFKIVNQKEFEHKLDLANGRAKKLEVGDRVGDITTQMNVADCPLNLDLPPNFSFDTSGIYKGNSKLCFGSPTIITKKFMNVDEEGLILLEAAFKVGKDWRYIKAEKDCFYNAQKLIGLSKFDLDVTSTAAKYAVEYIQALVNCNIGKIPKAKAYSRMGWRDDSTFITPYKSNDYIVDTSKNSFAANALKQKGSFDEWLTVFKEIQSHSLARFIVDAALATPLLYILNERSFSVYVYTDSKYGKTATMKFGGSAWGDPDEIAKNFNSTQNGVEIAAALRSDFIMIMNEKQLAEVKNRAKNKLDLTAFLYLIGEGEGKITMTRDRNERKSYKWRLICLCNGETTIINDSATQGAITRTLIFNPTEKLVPPELSEKIYKTIKQHYGHAGQMFIERLMKEDFEKLRNVYVETYKALQELHPQYTIDHIRYVSLISMADSLIHQYFLTLDEKQAYTDALNLAHDIITQLKTENELADVQREWSFFTGWLAENDAHFIGSKRYEDAKSISTYGKIEAEYIYVVTKSIKDAAEKAGLSFDKMIHDFIKAEYVLTGTVPKDRKRAPIDSTQKIGEVATRCIKIPREKI